MPRFRLIPEVHLVLVRDDQVLLLQRHDTGYEDGKYSVVAGHVDGNETARSAMCREAQEEADLQIDPDDLDLCHLMHRRSDDERMSLFFTARRWSGEPRNAEPHKCSHLGWFALDALPAAMVSYVRLAIGHVLAGRPYSELGWDAAVRPSREPASMTTGPAGAGR